ncbi:hypothetical protein BJV82DRAFT_607186 [Fennellomyces sp. T-0311]|nr:hypothetical protein BJV82DRAFT_607186 [Fennellomyces sp. T-0311]
MPFFCFPSFFIMQSRSNHCDRLTERDCNPINAATRGSKAAMNAPVDFYNSRSPKKSLPKSPIQEIGAAHVPCPDRLLLPTKNWQPRYRYTPRFDIIKHLPLEIVHQILVHVQQRDIVQCVQVSQAWCSQVKRCGKWFRCISVGPGVLAIGTEIFKCIPWIGCVIEELELAHSSRINEQWLKYMKDGMYDNIRVLKVNLGRTLAPLLCQILTHFHTLEDLQCTTTKDLIVPEQPLPTVKCTNLKSLELRYHSTKFLHISRLLTMCPNLRRFIAFGTGSSIDISSILITDICPSLKVVGLNSTNDIPGLKSPQCTTEGPPGLVHLSISLGQHFRVRNTIALAQANAKTIKQLHIVVHKPDRVYPVLPPIKFTNLETLCFENKVPSHIAHETADIFQYFTIHDNTNFNLCELTLQSPPPLLDSTTLIMALTISCPSLRSLSIHAWPTFNDDSISVLATGSIEELSVVGRTALSVAGISIFLNGIAQKLEPKLKTLKFQDMGFSVTDTIFAPLLRITSLEKIELNWCFLLSPRGIENFLTNATYHCTSLKEVYMAVSGVFIFQLSKYPKSRLVPQERAKSSIDVYISSNDDQLHFYV